MTISREAIEAAKKWLDPDEPVSVRLADEACRELLRLAALERPDDDEPITAEWLSRVCEVREDVMDDLAYCLRIPGNADQQHASLWFVIWDDLSGGFWEQDGRHWNGTGASWKFQTRRQLRDLYRGLMGKELEERP